LIAPTRRHDAAEPLVDVRSESAHDRWREAVKIRQEWLDHGLSTRPADRQAAEHSLTAIYAGMLRPRPRFAWVESPYQAIPLIAGRSTLDRLYAWIRDPHPRGTPPLASDLVVVDRPERVHTEPVPGTWQDEVRLRRDGVRYRDGWDPLLA
jgi:hypothetical protein